MPHFSLKAVFVGGLLPPGGAFSNRVDVLNITTQTVTTYLHPDPSYSVAASLGPYVYMLGGFAGDVYVFDVRDGSFSKVLFVSPFPSCPSCPPIRSISDTDFLSAIQ